MEVAHGLSGFRLGQAEPLPACAGPARRSACTSCRPCSGSSSRQTGSGSGVRDDGIIRRAAPLADIAEADDLCVALRAGCKAGERHAPRRRPRASQGRCRSAAGSAAGRPMQPPRCWSSIACGAPAFARSELMALAASARRRRAVLRLRRERARRRHRRAPDRACAAARGGTSSLVPRRERVSTTVRIRR